MLNVRSLPVLWSPPIELLSDRLQTIAPTPIYDEGSGPFFSLQSLCEDHPTYRPFFVVMRGECDVLFPTGTIARAFATQQEASLAALHCNHVFMGITAAYDRQQQSEGDFAFFAAQRVMNCLMEEISTICFLTKRELTQGMHHLQTCQA